MNNTDPQPPHYSLLQLFRCRCPTCRHQPHANLNGDIFLRFSTSTGLILSTKVLVVSVADLNNNSLLLLHFVAALVVQVGQRRGQIDVIRVYAPSVSARRRERYLYLWIILYPLSITTALSCGYKALAGIINLPILVFILSLNQMPSVVIQWWFAMLLPDSDGRTISAAVLLLVPATVGFAVWFLLKERAPMVLMGVAASFCVGLGSVVLDRICSFLDDRTTGREVEKANFFGICVGAVVMMGVALLSQHSFAWMDQISWSNVHLLVVNVGFAAFALRHAPDIFVPRLLYVPDAFVHCEYSTLKITLAGFVTVTEILLACRFVPVLEVLSYILLTIIGSILQEGFFSVPLFFVWVAERVGWIRI